MYDSSASPWTVVRQPPLSMGFPRQANSLPFPVSMSLPNGSAVLSIQQNIFLWPFTLGLVMIISPWRPHLELLERPWTVSVGWSGQSWTILRQWLGLGLCLHGNPIPSSQWLLTYPQLGGSSGPFGQIYPPIPLSRQLHKNNRPWRGLISIHLH